MYTHCFKYCYILSTIANKHFSGNVIAMGKSARDVIASLPKEVQMKGITKNGIMNELTKAGFGSKKTMKRTLELIVSAMVQSDLSTNEEGDILYWSPYWPHAYKTPIGNKLDTSRICAIYYNDLKDPRHNVPLRVDGRRDQWILE